MDMTLREGSGPERRLRSLILWGAVVLCAAPLSCSRRGGAKLFTSSRTEPLVEGTGVGTLRIDATTLPEAASYFGVSPAENARAFDRGLTELRTPLFQLSFVPPADGQGPPRLYAVRAVLQEDVYLGKTSKGIGFLDSLEAIREAYGPPDAEQVRMFSERLHYYATPGVIFMTQHPKQMPPAVYTKACAALGKQPGEGPDAAVVTGIMVIRPFTVTKAASTMMAGQQVLSTPPETDLRVSPF